MSVRTAANACSRVGLGTTAAGAARTCSDRVGWSAGDGLGQGLKTASIAVSLFDRLRGRGCHRGGRISHTRFGRIRPCTTTGRRIPILHGFNRKLRSVQSLPFGSQAFLLAPTDRSLYIASREARNRATASSTVVEAHAERGLQQPNSRIGGEYSPPGAARPSPSTSRWMATR